MFGLLVERYTLPAHKMLDVVSIEQRDEQLVGRKGKTAGQIIFVRDVAKGRNSCLKILIDEVDTSRSGLGIRSSCTFSPAYSTIAHAQSVISTSPSPPSCPPHCI